MKKQASMLISALVLLPMADRATAGDIRIDAIGARLFYETTGTLSDDIIQSRPTLWNTTIGAGDAKEPANSFLAIVALSGPPDSFEEQTLAIKITARNPDGKTRTIIARTFEGLYFAGAGRLAKAVLAEDAVCGDVTISASIGKQKKTETIAFGCGE